jgi:hypothetical protein
MHTQFGFSILFSSNYYAALRCAAHFTTYLFKYINIEINLASMLFDSTPKVLILLTLARLPNQSNDTSWQA